MAKTHLQMKLPELIKIANDLDSLQNATPMNGVDGEAVRHAIQCLRNVVRRNEQ